MLNQIDNTDLPGAPALVSKGINPAAYLYKVAEPCYLSYYSQDEFIDKNLQKYQSETETEYKKRKKKAYTLCLVERAITKLCETVASIKYEIQRVFGKYKILEEITTQDDPVAGNYNAKLKDLCINMMLGGIAYVYISLKETEEIEGDKTNDINYYILRYDQVYNILMNEDGYITQCQILGKQGEKEIITRFVDDKWWRWERTNENESFELIEEGENSLGFAPLVVVIYKGTLHRTDEITSPIHNLVRIEAAILDKMSAKDKAQIATNYPQLTFPIGAASAIQSAKTKHGKKKVHGKEDKLVVGSEKVILYDAESKPPAFIEPEHKHIITTWEDIEKSIQQGEEIVGTGVHDHELASGVAKSFNYSNLSDTRRTIHSKLRQAELSTLYITALLLEETENFSDFTEQVKIIHPTSFDPVGDIAYKRLKEAIEIGDFSSLPPKIQNLLREFYYATAVKEKVTPEQLMEFTILLKKELNDVEQQTEGDNDISTDIDGDDNPNESDTT
jgi:hypothetical protein